MNVVKHFRLGLSLLLVFAALAIATWACLGIADEINGNANKTDEDPWKLVWIDHERPIKRLELKLYSMKESPWGDTGIAGEQGIDIVVDDPIALRTVAEALRAPLARGVSRDGASSVSGVGYQVGSLKVTAADKSFEILIDTGGFFVGPDLVMSRAFYSWALAQQVDDLVFLETKTHIPLDVFRTLSGESLIASDRTKYYVLRKADKIKQMKKHQQSQGGD